MIWRELKDFLRFDVRVALSRYLLNRKKVDKARQYLDAAFATGQDIPLYVLAFDARLMVFEDRHFDARDRYRECLNRIPKDMSPEDTYISHYCRFMMAVYDINCSYADLEEMRHKTASLETDWLIKLFLPTGSKRLLLENFGHRNPVDHAFRLKNGPMKASRAYYHADF